MMKIKRLPISTGLGLLLLLLTAVFSIWGAGANSGTRHFLSGQIPAAVARLNAIKDYPLTNEMHLAIGLPLRNQAELDGLLKKIYDPTSASYHHYLSPEQFTKNFGPTRSDYQSLIDFAKKNGLRVTGTHSNRLVLDVAGSVSDIDKIFQVKVRLYKHPKEQRMFYAPDVEPSVDATGAVSILNVSGLDNYAPPHPASLHVMPVNQVPGATPNSGSGSGGTYLGRDFRLAYAPGTTMTGAGQSVALLQFDGYYSNDITIYESLANIPAVSLVNIPVGDGVSTPGDGNDEVSLDIEMVISMAPGLSKIFVYEAPNPTAWSTILSQIADDNLAPQVSCSWTGGSPDPASEEIFKQMAAQGQSFYNACGDDDAFTGAVSFPAESPNITQVGGTTLTTASRGTRVSEVVWNRGDGTGTGGGISTDFSIPTWQQGINSFLTNGGSMTARNIPDVAMTAENVLVRYGNGQVETAGGTSCSAPLWAGFTALVNQQAAINSKPAVGFINPAIYEIANESIYKSTFNDITNGDNTSTASPNAFYAVPGYDLCTGLGTPRGVGLISALVNPDPLNVVSNGGFIAIGTPAGLFNITAQTFYVTNAGTSPLVWSLVSTSAWLDVSNTGGMLTAGAGDSVAVNLNLIASNLTAGTYTANLIFSNVTSGVAHSRFFVLETSDPLVILPTNNFTFAGPPSGPLTPDFQEIILTNLSLVSFNWALNNTSTWFNVSPVSGSLAPGAQTSIIFTPAPAASNLVDGIYNALFQITNLTSQYVQQVGGTLSVGIVQNGGFETGDFLNWTLQGNGYANGSLYNGVVDASSLTDGSGSSFIHSGTYGAFLGDTNLATLSQTISTTAGQNYLLSFWLANPMSGLGQQFLVNWNTNSISTNQIYLLNNPPVSAWTKITFVVSATDTNTTLQFGAKNPPDGFGLDDVEVVSISPPTITSQPTNLVVLAGSSAVFNATATGFGPLNYQWQKNNGNLADGAGISGTTTPSLMLAVITTNSAGNYTLVVTNAYGSVTSSVVTLTVVLPPGINGVAANPDGSITLNLTGSPGISYVLESTTNLFSSDGWVPVATNGINPSGVWQFNDLQATNFPQRFYRLKYTQ